MKHIQVYYRYSWIYFSNHEISINPIHKKYFKYKFGLYISTKDLMEGL